MMSLEEESGKPDCGCDKSVQWSWPQKKRRDSRLLYLRTASWKYFGEAVSNQASNSPYQGIISATTSQPVAPHLYVDPPAPKGLVYPTQRMTMARSTTAYAVGALAAIATVNVFVLHWFGGCAITSLLRGGQVACAHTNYRDNIGSVDMESRLAYPPIDVSNAFTEPAISTVIAIN